jgi:hypothetical protein
MTVAAEDAALYGVVSGAAPENIDEVIAIMKRIDDLLGNDDGLKWFNRMYLMVTEQVDLCPPAGGWKDAAWLLKLDVVFAGFYFRAVAGFLAGDATVPSSWTAMLRARRLRADRIQFALAGMNAHINHDLALALLATDAQVGSISITGGPQYVDYETVNELLNTVMPRALTMLAADVLGMVAEDTGKVGRLLAFWNICKARELAWQFAGHLRELEGVPRTAVLMAQDQMTGVLGRAILAFA